MATEVNTSVWPGPDLAPISDGAYALGELPAVAFISLKELILAAGNGTSVQRSE